MRQCKVPSLNVFSPRFSSSSSMAVFVSLIETTVWFLQLALKLKQYDNELKMLVAMDFSRSPLVNHEVDMFYLFLNIRNSQFSWSTTCGRSNLFFSGIRSTILAGLLKLLAMMTDAATITSIAPDTFTCSRFQQKTFWASFNVEGRVSKHSCQSRWAMLVVDRRFWLNAGISVRNFVMSSLNCIVATSRPRL